MPSHIGHCFFNVTIIAQHCVPAVTFVHPCTDVAHKMVKAQGCKDLVAKAVHEAKPIKQQSGSEPQQSGYPGGVPKRA